MGYPSNAITTTSIGYPNAPANATLQPITVGDLDTSSQYCYQGEQKGIAGRAHRSCVCLINNYHVGNGEQPTHSAHTHVTLTTHPHIDTHPSVQSVSVRCRRDGGDGAHVRRHCDVPDADGADEPTHQHRYVLLIRVAACLGLFVGSRDGMLT